MENIKKHIIETWQHSGFQKYFRNTGWMFVGQLSMILSFIMNIWLARYFGPEKYGVINYTLAFVGIFGFIANFGISEILIRELVKRPDDRNKLLGTSFGLLTFSGFLAFSISVISGLLTEDNALIRLLIILYSSIFIFSPVNVISAYFQSTLQSKKNALAQIIGVLFVSCFKIFLILNGKGVIWIIFAFILDYIIGSILYLINYKQSKLKISDWIFDSKTAIMMIKPSLLLMLSSATGYLLLKIDQIMIKQYMTEEAVGLYAVAVKMVEVWYFIPGVICASLFPAIINAKHNNSELYRQRLKKLFSLLLTLSISISIPISILAPFIIKVLYGVDYLSSISILQIYIWSSIGYFLNIGINKFFIAENYLKSIFIFNALSAILNIILNIILIPKIGITGAAWATLISYTFGSIIVYLIYKIKNIKYEIR